jgi:hypothetical protein
MMVQILSLIAFLADKMVMFIFTFVQFIPTIINIVICYGFYYTITSASALFPEETAFSRNIS